MLNRAFNRVVMATVLAFPIAGVVANGAIAEGLEFTLKNQTSVPLVEFYVEASSIDNWGEDILTQSVQPGEAGTVTIADGKTTCTYDIRGVFADGDVVEQRELNLCQLGSYTYTEE